MRHERVEVRPHLELHAAVSDSVAEGGPRPVIVFSHGFVTSGIESHGLFIRASREAVKRGYSTVLFDYEGSGYSDGEYSDFRVSSSVSDLASIVRWALRNTACDGRCVIFGQSLGSALGALAAPLLSDAVGGLVLWNLSGRLENRYPKIFGISPTASTAQCVPGKGQYVGPDFLADAAKSDVLQGIGGLTVPLLLLSCTGDDIGDPTIADAAASLSRHPATLRVRLDASHTFQCQPVQEFEAIQSSLNWVDRSI